MTSHAASWAVGVTGMDVGQARDYAALVTIVPDSTAGSVAGRWVAARPERVPLGTSYTALASCLTGRLDLTAAIGLEPVGAVDGTGIGRAVVEQARETTTYPVLAVTATGGTRLHVRGNMQGLQGRDITVPPSGMLGIVAAWMRTGRLRLDAADPATASLRDELDQLARTPAGRVEARHGHDDVAFAFAIAVTVVAVMVDPDEARRTVETYARANRPVRKKAV